MIGFTSSQRYWLYKPVTDMRKSFDALSGLVQNEIHRELLSGEVFIFFNRPRNRMKLLVWDRSGLVIYYKRLEKGNFELPIREIDDCGVEIKWDELVMILEGIRLESVVRRKRYCLAEQ